MELADGGDLLQAIEKLATVGDEKATSAHRGKGWQGRERESEGAREKAEQRAETHKT